MKIDELQKLLEEGRKEMNEQLANAKTRCDNMKLEIDGLKTENKAEDRGGDEAVIKAVVDAIVQNVVCISAMEIEKDNEDMVKRNCEKMKDLNEKIRKLEAESKKQEKEFKDQARKSKSEIIKLKQKWDKQISMKNKTIEYVKEKMEADKARIKGLEEKIKSDVNRAKVSEMIGYHGYPGYAPLPNPHRILEAVDDRIQEKSTEWTKTLKKIMTEIETLKEMKKSSDNVKSENDTKSDNGNQEEWTTVEGKKKRKSDKNVTVKVMKSKNGNYWVSMIIKKKS